MAATPRSVEANSLRVIPGAAHTLSQPRWDGRFIGTLMSWCAGL